MSYDFDWNGTTLAIGDEEAQSFVLPLEPTVNQLGIDAPGLLSALTDFINLGVFNGNFRLGPPNPALNIDVATSTSGSNFMPGWRFVQSSNTAITVAQVRDAASPSGSNLRFTFASGAASDAAYIEQVIDIGGSRQRAVADRLRIGAAVVSGTNVRARILSQYLSTDGSIAGMPGENQGPAIPTLSNYGSITASPLAAPPSHARYLRLRVEAYRLSGSAAATLDLYDVRRDRGIPYLVIPDEDGAQPPALVKVSAGIPLVTPPVSGSPAMPLGYQLVALDFVLLSIPASATTELTPSDAAAGTLGASPRIYCPWDGSIVGLSYRMSAAPTAGTINIQATVGGANVWAPWGALGTTMALADKASQAIDTDTFSAGQGLGVQVVTSAAYTPATRNIVATLWLAVEWTNP